MCLVALFEITKNWKQPKYPSPGDWINKLWCIRTMEYYSAVKKNYLQIPTTAGVFSNASCRGGKESQTRKATHRRIPLIQHAGKGHIYRNRKQIWCKVQKHVKLICGDRSEDGGDPERGREWEGERVLWGWGHSVCPLGCPWHGYENSSGWTLHLCGLQLGTMCREV